MRRLFTFFYLVLIVAVVSSCCPKGADTAVFTKKYTNADFYKDGVFQEDVAKRAYLEMFEFYDYSMTPFLEANWWVSDFGFGDFENCGMGGVFWVNDRENSYFAHDMYLLPGQMVPEHNHKATDVPAKIEGWKIRNGYVYNFVDDGEPTAGAEALIPESQRATTHSRNYFKFTVEDGPLRIGGEEGDWHFMIAGENGSIIQEFANYQDNAGMSLSNPKAQL